MSENVKSSVWVLKRVNTKDGEIFQLNNNGPTTLGRNESADIVCEGTNVSRNHCTIAIDSGQKRIFLSDRSSNGTLVNDILVKKCTRELKANDILAIGCNKLAFEATRPYEYYLLKLMNLEDVPVLKTSVDLTAEDEEIDDKEALHRRLKVKLERPSDAETSSNVDLSRLKHSPIYFNDDEPMVNDDQNVFDFLPNAVDIKAEPVANSSKITSCWTPSVDIKNQCAAEPEAVAGPSGLSSYLAFASNIASYTVNTNGTDIVSNMSGSDDQKPSSSNHDLCVENGLSSDAMPENDVDEELHFSQQVIFNIKQEADQSFEYDSGERRVVNTDPIIISDDDDEPDAKDNKWSASLSQNQDKIIEKLKAKEIKRKSLKIIDPIPQTQKKSRCVSETVPSTSKLRHSIETGKLSSSSRTQNGIPIRRKSLSEDSTSKLFEMAPKPSCSSKPEAAKTCTRPKVKESKSRGDFLTAEQPPPAPIGARRKSLDVRRTGMANKADGKSNSRDQKAAENATKPYETILKPKGVPIQRKSRVPTIDSKDTNSSTLQNVAGSSKGVPSDANIAVKPLGHFDHFDPFKVKMSKTDKSHNGKRTFDDIIQEVDKIPIPKNGRKGVSPVRDDQCAAKTARKSATNNHRTEAQSNVSQPNRKSILRPSNQPRHHRKNIILNMDKNEIKEFEAGSDEDNEIIQQVLSFAAKEDEVSIEKHPTLSNFQRDPIHKVIANILQWEVDWLTESDQEPQVNGHGLVEMPMLQRYESFEMYQCTIIPLMMRELWAQIRGDYRSRKSPSFNAEVIHANDERRGVSTRRVFMCKTTQNPTIIINLNDLKIVQAGSAQYLAFVTECHCRNNMVFFTMEMSKQRVDQKIPKDTKTLMIRHISNIRIDMKLFTAVFTLKDCPLREYLLRPLDKAMTPKSRLPYRFEYKGHETLSKSQLKVLEDVYAECRDHNKHVTLIEGPPGTGKSRLIVALILQLIFSQEKREPFKILLCAPSNAAVDVLATKLIKIRQRITTPEKMKRLTIVRYGVIDKMHKDVRPASLNALLDRILLHLCDTPELNALKMEHTKVTTAIEYLEKSGHQGTSGDKIRQFRQQQQQISQSIQRQSRLADNARIRHSKSIELINGATVVCSTLSSAINLLTYSPMFDICVVDEASQCTEPWTLVPLLLNVSSMILVGDSQQLPAVVLSGEAKKLGFDRSLFTRIQDAYIGSEIKPNVYSLREQFRMHPDICHFSNQYFYKQKLTTNPIAIDYFFRLNPYNVFSLDFLQSIADKYNYHNTEEADFVIEILKVAKEYADPKAYSYGIITPYSAQKEQIVKRLRQIAYAPELYPVNTIDSYQGQEKDIIIISYARTSGTGFLIEPKRLNVAMTRARKCLIICANFTALKNVPVWKNLLDNSMERECLYKKTQNISNKEWIAQSLIKSE